MFESLDFDTYRYNLDAQPDLRRSRRRPSVGMRLTNPVPGDILDVSPNGLGIVCSHPLRVHQHYALTLAFEGGLRTHRRGEVRWCRLTRSSIDDNGNPRLLFRMGVALLDP